MPSDIVFFKDARKPYTPLWMWDLIQPSFRPESVQDHQKELKSIVIYPRDEFIKLNVRNLGDVFADKHLRVRCKLGLHGELAVNIARAYAEGLKHTGLTGEEVEDILKKLDLRGLMRERGRHYWDPIFSPPQPTSDPLWDRLRELQSLGVATVEGTEDVDLSKIWWPED